MEIQNIGREYGRNIHQKLKFQAKALKQIKYHFYQLIQEKNFDRKESIQSFIDQIYRNISTKLNINQRKVLKAYISYHLNHSNKQINERKQIKKHDGREFQNLERRKGYNNKLFDIFKNWFSINFLLKSTSIRKNQFILYQTNLTQQLLISLTNQAVLNQQKNQKIETYTEDIRIKGKFDFCQITIALILTTQLNLCILLLYKRQFSSINLILKQAKQTKCLLQQIFLKKQSQIQKNLRQVQVFHDYQRKQLKDFHLKCRKVSLKYLQLSSNQKNNNKQKNQIKIEKQEDRIISKFSKKIEDLLEKNKRLIQEKIKFQLILQNLKLRMMKIQNYLDFQIHQEIDFFRQKGDDYEIKLFIYEKLNKFFKKYINQYGADDKKSISDLIFSGQFNSQKSMYLSVDRNKKNVEICIKDDFNLCLLLKKTNNQKQAIIYFQTLLYHYTKKQILEQYCLKQYRLYEDLEQSEQEQIQNFVKKIIKNMLERFIRNQELLKIYVYSIINLVELYEHQKAFHWSIVSLKMVAQVLQFDIIRYLSSIKARFLQLNTEDQKDQMIKLNDFASLQKECEKLVQKYNSMLEEVKFKIIKSSFNKNLFKYLSPEKSQIKSTLSSKHSPFVRSPRTTVSYLISPKMKKLQSKENQLLKIIENKKQQKQAYNYCFSSTQSPLNQKSNKMLITQAKIFQQKINFNKLYQFKHKKQKKGNIYRSNKYIKRKKINFQAEKIISQRQKLQACKQSEFELNSKKKLNLKNSVKFQLFPFQNFQPSLIDLGTSKSIESNKKNPKNHTLNFLDTSKCINFSTKTTRMCEFRQKLLQNRVQLEDYIKLTFQKLNLALRNPYNSAISLTDMKGINADVSLEIDQIVNNFNQLLESLKRLFSRSQETFQRQILIEAKIKLVQKIKDKVRMQKLIDINVELLSDLTLLKNNQKRLIYKKIILYQLASYYFSIKDYKNSVSIYLELARLGDSTGYLKMGQLYMIIQDYENSVKCYQKYAIQRNFDLLSRVKLSHAYSKIPQYYMKTMDMLMGILLQCGSYSKFKPQIYQRKYDDKLIQSAVILLSSLHFNNQNIQKAIDLCQSYCKINIKNYRVFHILGGYYKMKNQKRKSFQSYLNALQNNHFHHKSLIQLTQFVCEGYQYKSHAVELLRKCYCVQSKNFDLLKTLIKFLKSGQKIHIQQQSISLDYQTLIKYAQRLKQSKVKGFSTDNFYQEASLVYQWALDLLDKSANIANLLQIEQIYKNLGEISLKKGDYIKSQAYYKLYLLQIEKHINRSNLNQDLKNQKINATKVKIYYFLGKVKKNQNNYRKAIFYFQSSFQLQKKANKKLQTLNIISQFFYFQVGHCYFLMEQYQIAYEKLFKHKIYLLYFISLYDQNFFSSQKDINLIQPEYLKNLIKIQDLRTNKQFKKMNNNQNQILQKQDGDINNYSGQQRQLQFKKNYFQNQLLLAFCLDKQKRFIESKQIYKKISDYFREVQKQIEKRQHIKKIGKKLDSKSEQEKRMQRNFKFIVNNKNELKEELKEYRKISLINLSNIYKIEGVENKYVQVMEEYIRLYPQKLVHRNPMVEMYLNSKNYSQENDNPALALI